MIRFAAYTATVLVAVAVAPVAAVVLRQWLYEAFDDGGSEW